METRNMENTSKKALKRAEYIKECKVCSTEFAAKRSDKVFCSDRCRMNFNKYTRPQEELQLMEAEQEQAIQAQIKIDKKKYWQRKTIQEKALHEVNMQQAQIVDEIQIKATVEAKTRLELELLQTEQNLKSERKMNRFAMLTEHKAKIESTRIQAQEAQAKRDLDLNKQWIKTFVKEWEESPEFEGFLKRKRNEKLTQYSLIIDRFTGTHKEVEKPKIILGLHKSSNKIG